MLTEKEIAIKTEIQRLTNILDILKPKIRNRDKREGRVMYNELKTKRLLLLRQLGY